MVYYAKKHPTIPFYEIKELERFMRAASRLRCTFELIANPGSKLQYEERASDLLLALLLQKSKERSLEIDSFLRTSDYGLIREPTLS